MRLGSSVLLLASLAAAVSALFFSSCSPSRQPRIIILHTGRLVGNIHPLEARGVAPLQYYPYLAGYVKKVREEARSHGDTVLLIDSGDSLLGSFASYATHGMNVVAFMNALQYDAVCLGNLDSNVSGETLGQLKAKVLSPFVTLQGKPLLPGLAPVADLEKAGLRIRLISNFYGDFPPSEAPLRFPMWFIKTNVPVQPVRDYAAAVKGMPEADLTLFNWLKFEPEDSRTTPFFNTLTSLGVDAVLAHRIYSANQIDAWDPQPGSAWPIPVSANLLRQNGGFSLARLDLARTGGGWQPAGSQVIQMTANTAPRDPEIITLINSFAEQVRDADEELGTLDRDISRTSILQHYLAALSSIPDADLVLYSSNAIRSEWIKGPLTASKVFNSVPWTNELVRFEATPEQLAKIAALPDLARLRRLDGGSTVVTSRYFAAVLQAQAGVQPGQIKPATSLNEFTFFKAWLKQRGARENPPAPGGWAYEGSL
jgi:2',3'-cyclic-nucleotide 2'-phosphodiesterase (5'-nucleotidase family)